jgi:hypothetical protein
MERIRPTAAVPRAWWSVSGAHSGLSGSQPTTEATRPASVRVEAARWLVLAGATRTGCTVTARVARAVARPATAHRWTVRGKVSSASTLAQWRRRWARGKGARLTLATARCEGAERRRWRKGGGRCRGREGSGEWRGGRRGGEGGGCGATSEQDENTAWEGGGLGRRQRGSLFKRGAGGEAAERGRASRATRGGGAGESEGGLGTAGERLGSRQRPPAGRRGRRRCHATVEGCGVGATRDGAADRWAGTRRGPVISGWVRGRGSAARH